MPPKMSTSQAATVTRPREPRPETRRDGAINPVPKGSPESGSDDGNRPIHQVVFAGLEPIASSPGASSSDLEALGLPKKKKKTKKGKKKKKKKSLSDAGVEPGYRVVTRDDDVDRIPLVKGEGPFIVATQDISIGEMVCAFSPMASSAVHPHEGVQGEDGKMSLENTQAVHILHLFAAGGYSWETVARRLLHGSSVDDYLEHFRDEFHRMVAKSGNVVGMTLGTLLMTLQSTDEWIQAQLMIETGRSEDGAVVTESLQELIDPRQLFGDAHPWLFVVIHAMRTSNTHSLVDPIHGHGRDVMATYPGLTRVFSITGMPKDFNAVMALGEEGLLHVFAMRPIARGERVVVVFSDAMAVGRDDQTNINILNLIMALRKMTGEVFEAEVARAILGSLQDMDLPSKECIPAALQAARDDAEKYDRIRAELQNLEIFEKTLSTFKRVGTRLQGEVAAKRAAIRDTIAVLLTTITLHTSDPAVWSESAAAVNACVDADEEPLTAEDISTLRSTCAPKKGSATKLRFGVSSFDEDAPMSQVEPYCMFMATMLCSSHAKLDPSVLTWIPEDVLPRLDRTSDIARVCDLYMEGYLHGRVRRDLEAIHSAYDNIDTQFLASLEYDVQMQGRAGVMNQMAKLEEVLRAVSMPDDDDEAKVSDDEAVDVVANAPDLSRQPSVADHPASAGVKCKSSATEEYEGY